jgi:putative transposase
MPSKKTTKAAAAAAAALPTIPRELIDQFVTGQMSAETVQAARWPGRHSSSVRWERSCCTTWGYAPGAAKAEETSNPSSLHSSQARAPLPQLRRQDRAHVRTRHHRARDPGLPGRAVRHQRSPEFLSSVTDAPMAESTAWQARPLEPMYPVVFFDALHVKRSARTE